MDWKTKALLFVLVLFGSVVPASAQDAQGYAGIIQNISVSVSAAFGVLVTLLAFWWKFTDKLDRTNERIDAVKKELKDDAQKAHAEIGTNIRTVHVELGTNIRESEKRLNDNINKVHATVQLLLEQAIRGQSSGSAQDRP